MSGFKNKLDASEELGRFKNRIIMALFIILALVINGWDNVQNDIDVYIPPDLRSGAKIKAGGEPDDSTIYLFAQNFLQQINHWKNNGAKDFPKNINMYSYYLTPSYRNDLKQQAKTKLKAGELTNRTRSFMPIPGKGFDEKWVVPISKGVWLVWLDVEIKEEIFGQPVKHIISHYPIRVVTYDVNRFKNPFKLALDGNEGYKETKVIVEGKG